MKDQYGREIDYLRISVTDNCNLHCGYCMPEYQKERNSTECIQKNCIKNNVAAGKKSNQTILTQEELRRLAHIFSALGIRKVKLTGGEPLLRSDIAEIIAMLKNECRMESVTLTTNGVLLAQKSEELVQAGLDGTNISLDTTDREKYAEITGTDCLDTVLHAIEACKKQKNLDVKINCVLMEQEDAELLELAKLAQNDWIAVRFIEQMPIGHMAVSQKWTEERVKELFMAHGLSFFPCAKGQGNGPAHYVQVEGYVGTIGFISALAHKFCGECNRIRLTAHGFVKPCLQYGTGTELKELLRSGMSDETVQEAIRQCIYEKPQCHHFTECGTGGIETENMAEIGG